MLATGSEWDVDRESNSLDVFLLGVVDFESAVQLQQRFRDEVIARQDRHGVLIVCEHPPIVTVGREGSQSQFRRDATDWRRAGVDVRWLNRGGGAWIQLPGQISAYPIVPLRRCNIGLLEYRRRLELALLDVCRELHVAGHRIEEEPGVFCKLGQLATVGVAVRSWVSYHGLTLNVRPDLSLLRQAKGNSRGVKGTSLEAARQRLTAIPEVRESLIRNLAERLGYESTNLFTQIPGLVRSRPR